MHRHILSRGYLHVRSACVRKMSMVKGTPNRGNAVAESTDNATKAPAFYPASFWLDMYISDAQEWLREHNRQWWQDNEKDGANNASRGPDFDDFEISTVGQEEVVRNMMQLSQVRMAALRSRKGKLEILFGCINDDDSHFISKTKLMYFFSYACPLLGVELEAVKEAIGSELSLRQISKGRFVKVLLELMEEFRDALEFDCAVWLLIDQANRRPFCPPGVVDQIRPVKYAQFVTSLPTHEFSRHIGYHELQEIMRLCPDKLILFDVRGRLEREVSTVRGAYVLEVERDFSGEHLYQIVPEDLDRASEFLFNVLEKDDDGDSLGHPDGLYGSHAVVTFCNTGLRGAAAAISLAEELDYPVYSLCGGLINYFNLGGELVGPFDEPTPILHPGSENLMEFITRENLFGGPARKGNAGVTHQC